MSLGFERSSANHQFVRSIGVNKSSDIQVAEPDIGAMEVHIF